MKGIIDIKLVMLSALLVFAGVLVQKASAQSSAAKVILTEYSDYQCPACAYFHPIVKRLKTTFGEKLNVEYKFFPLNSHQYGALSARAAQAAGNQGKFLEMHNLLFENQDRWSSSGNPQAIFVSYAKKLGLNVEQFKEDLNAAETQRTVMEEKEEGVEMGVDSTPTFFINGQKIEENPATYSAFKELIESFMKEETQ